MQEEGVVEQTIDVPVPQIATKIPEVVETILQERIWCMFEEPQVAAKILEVIKVPQIDNFSVPQVAAEILEVVEITPKDRISERMHKQTVDQPGDQVCQDPADLLHRQG